MTVGKIDDAIYSQAIDVYKKRLSHYIPFEIIVIPDIKKRKNLSEKDQRTEEGLNILKKTQPGDYIILLDEKGEQHTSVEFAQLIEKRIQITSKRVIFIVGGPYGFSPDVYLKANEKISLSKMTFTHQMVRLVFVEQLYRAMTILNNEPYHHD